MNLEFLSEYDNQHYIKLGLGFSLAALISFISIPNILKVSYRKRLMAVPGERSSHKKLVPNLGGIAIFFALIVTISIFTPHLVSHYVFFVASLVILFFVGFLDDILVVRPRIKLYAQILTAIMIVIGSDVRIKSFFGLFGIGVMPDWFSFIFTIFVFITLINAYNLIDGIDGLAGSLAVISSLCFIYIFLKLRDFEMVILAVALLGSIISFLYFNLSSRLKIFMGDTGSMVVGFVITFMLIRFMNLCSEPYIRLDSAPILAMSIFIIPIVDTLSVFLIRALKKQSPFSPTKSHLHHRFLNLGFSHIQTSLIISFINIIIFSLAYFFRYTEINRLAFIVMPTAFFLSFLPVLVANRMTKKKKFENPEKSS